MQKRIQGKLSTHYNDLALAQACAGGDSAAWHRFHARFSQPLQTAAMALVKDKQLARELADTLLADLFPRGPDSSFKLLSYAGRGSLESWLKVLLFQANIDRHRVEQRFTSYEDNIKTLAASTRIGIDFEYRFAEDFDRSLRDAIGELKPEDRFVLASHFFDGQSLAQIASVLQVHESTVSRRVNKALAKMRRGIIRKIKPGGLSARERANIYTEYFANLSLDLRAELLFGIELAKEQL